MLGAAPTVAELLYTRRMYGGGKRALRHETWARVLLTAM
jgi:hypothetical protein